MDSVVGALPLIAIDALVIDTETTGLDTATARIVEIGAVPIARGRLEADEGIGLLINPGVSIPPLATAVHGITNAMVEDASPFRQVWERIQPRAEGRILIGHSIGFDLAVLANETARAGLNWRKPRSLCVRLLTSLLEAELPDHSLETIAAYLGVPMAQRHRALGDATTAARIFLALLPKLQARGIRTLAEAERASLRLLSLLEEGRRAGWADAVREPNPDRLYAPVDPYAYRHRVGDVMSKGPLTVNSRTTLADGLSVMAEKGISSLLVSGSGEPNQLASTYGIVTERDLMRKLAAEGATAFSAKLDSFASRPLASVRADAFVYRAIGRMERLNIRHLAVRSDEDKLVGIISARDLLRLRASQAIGLGDAIDAAKTSSELAAAWARLPTVADSLVEEGVEARIASEIISEELRALTRCAATLAEAEMIKEGAGAPPCAYAVMVLGSGGRGESLLAPDQDNALIFENGEPDGPEDRWFAELAAKLSDLLDIAGIPYCKGGVMARNPQWRGSVGVWMRRVEEWVLRSRPQDLLNVDIFFDLRPVCGERRLALDLLDHAYARASKEAAFAKLLGQQVSLGTNPFTLVGGLRTDGGRLDLKQHGLFPIVAFARALAIRHDLRLHSTKQRLEALIALGLGGNSELGELVSAQSLILHHLVLQQSRDLHAGIPVSNRVDLDRLKNGQIKDLKRALRRIRSIPDLLVDMMFS